MVTDCGGSWEESPPSLIDVAVRDRRWAQGNLQHLKIIGTSGLRLVSRMHLGVGIMSYLSSPLWLVMLGIGFALAVQSHLIRPEYFSHDFQLFPTWPRFDVDFMMALFWFSMIVLLIPKTLGLIRALLSKRIRRGAGGVIGVSASFLVETILSAPYAPILMMIQSRHVLEVFLGRDSGWKPQRRDSGSTTWKDAWTYHRRHMILSAVTSVIVYFIPPPLLAWLSPARVARREELARRSAALPEDGLRFLARHRDARRTHTWTPPPCQAFLFGFGSQELIAAIHPACECDAKSRALMEYAGRRLITSADCRGPVGSAG